MPLATPLWVTILLVLLPPALGIALALRLRKTHPGVGLHDALRRVPAVWGLVLAVVLPPAVALLLVWQNRIALQLPLAIQYWGPSAVLWLVMCAVGCLNGLGIALARAEGHAEWRKLLIAAVLVSAALCYAQVRYARPIAPALAHEVADDGSILQSSDASCAPATGANIARALGMNIREPEVARAMGTSRMFGTGVPQMIVGMREFGIDCTTVISASATADDVVAPAFLIVDHPAVGREGHVVGLMGRRGEVYDVIDPLFGRERWDGKKLREVWHGLAASCRRNSG